MKKALQIFLAVFAMFIVQTTVLPYFTFLEMKPDLLAAIIVYYTLNGDVYVGFCTGAVVGLLMDGMVGNLAIFYLLVYPLMGYVSAFAARFFAERLTKARLAMLLPPILCALIVAIYEALLLAYIYLNSVDISILLAFRSLRIVIYSALASLPVYYLLRFVEFLLNRRRQQKLPQQ